MVSEVLVGQLGLLSVSATCHASRRMSFSVLVYPYSHFTQYTRWWEPETQRSLESCWPYDIWKHAICQINLLRLDPLTACNCPIAIRADTVGQMGQQVWMCHTGHRSTSTHGNWFSLSNSINNSNDFITTLCLKNAPFYFLITLSKN